MGTLNTLTCVIWFAHLVSSLVTKLSAAGTCVSAGSDNWSLGGGRAHKMRHKPSGGSVFLIHSVKFARWKIQPVIFLSECRKLENFGN